ncbi:MAG: serine/threonine-protein kinase [Myxococcota bacterium]
MTNPPHQTFDDPKDPPSRPADELPTNVLDGRYHLYETIGHGGMGRVFRAHDSRLNREVAIKQLHARDTVHERARTMFRQETEIMARLRHPNVVAVYDSGGWDAHPYLVMPFHRSMHLEHWADQRGGPPLSSDVTMGIIGQLCAGLMAMHDAGVIHGDLKPRNVLVSDDLEVILVDLGLSRPMTANDDRQPLLGTPGYLAPEQIRDDTVDPRFAYAIDVYALGVTTYWLLTGQIPWGHGRPLDICIRQLEREILPPSQARPGLSPTFDEPLLDALHPQPARRPRVGELRDQLFHATRASGPRISPFIVVVDDDPDLLLFETEVTRTAVPHAEVVGVRDPRAALSIIDNRPPDLVMTDLKMPGINGIELTAMLRGKAATASIPVIALTGVGGAPDWSVLDQLGAQCLLVKPLRPQILGDTIRRALDLQPQ